MKAENININRLVNNTGQVKGLPKNPRFIRDDKFEKLKQSVQDDPEMLSLRELLVYPYDEKYVVLGGNMRLRACKELGYTEMECKVIPEGTPAKKLRAIVQKDNIGYGENDWDLLANEWDAEELDEWGLDTPDDWNEKEEIVEDEAPEVDESEPPKSKLGEIYQLGLHRVMCGDATKSEDVNKLMNGKRADMVFTDPPYGVQYTGGQFYSGKPVANRREMIKNDEVLIYDVAVKNIADHIDDGAIYISYASSYTLEVISQILSAGIEQRAIIVWYKTNTGYGDLNSNYKNNYEPIFYGVKKGRNSNFVGDTTQTTIYDDATKPKDMRKSELIKIVEEVLIPKSDVVAIDKPKRNDLHPTMKPIGLVARFIQNSSTPEEVVADTFLGSGSTLIACEQTGRTCYGMELDPKYVDVIRKRYHKFVTGNEEGWEDGTKAVRTQEASA